jgi:hypothetical protein
MTDAPKVLNDVVDVVLAYHPKPKSANGVRPGPRPGLDEAHA